MRHPKILYIVGYYEENTGNLDILIYFIKYYESDVLIYFLKYYIYILLQNAFNIIN